MWHSLNRPKSTAHWETLKGKNGPVSSYDGTPVGELVLGNGGGGGNNSGGGKKSQKHSEQKWGNRPDLQNNQNNDLRSKRWESIQSWTNQCSDNVNKHDLKVLR